MTAPIARKALLLFALFLVLSMVVLITAITGYARVVMVAGDIDGDKTDELIGIDPFGHIWITTDLSIWQSVSGKLSTLACGNFNGDAKNDAVGLSASGEIFYTTDFNNWHSIAGKLYQLTAGDLNGDGKGDVAGVTIDGQIYYTLDLLNWYPLLGELSQIAAGDLNGDGKDDLAGVTEDGQIFYTIDLYTWYSVPGTLRQLSCCDLNADGRDDLVGVDSSDQIWFSTNLSSWTILNGKLRQTTCGDFNADGQADVAGVTETGEVWYTLDRTNWHHIPGQFKPPEWSDQSYEYLNELRAKTGMIPLQQDPLLETAALNHAFYCGVNGVVTHYEEADLPGFTGYAPRDRTIYVGYHYKNVSECIGSSNVDERRATNGLMTAIYHRFYLFDLDIDSVGIAGYPGWFDGNFTSIFVYNMSNSLINELCTYSSYSGQGQYMHDVCAPDVLIGADEFWAAKDQILARNPELVIWPVDGDNKVDPAFFEETPDPLPDYSVSGNPVSAEFNPYYVQDVAVSQFRLFNDETGAEIQPTRLLDKATDPNGRFSEHEFALFPLERLDWNTWYRAELAYSIEGTEHSKIWRFRTIDLGVPVYTVTGSGEVLTVAPGSKFAVYVPPTSEFPSWQFHGTCHHMSFSSEGVDPNTIIFTVSVDSEGSCDLTVNGDRHFTIQADSSLLPFVDVPSTHWAFSSIKHLYDTGVTNGCDTNLYCPDRIVTRAQMAVFLERATRGPEFVPPAGTGLFNDIPSNYWARDWIEQLYHDGITGGCEQQPLRYCPENPVTRGQMAVFLLRAKYGPDYFPHKAEGIFNDVDSNHWARDWIEQLHRLNITTGCKTDPLRYCPEEPVTRAQMAVFLTRTFTAW